MGHTFQKWFEFPTSPIWCNCLTFGKLSIPENHEFSLKLMTTKNAGKLSTNLQLLLFYLFIYLSENSSLEKSNNKI